MDAKSISFKVDVKSDFIFLLKLHFVDLFQYTQVITTQSTTQKNQNAQHRFDGHLTHA